MSHDVTELAESLFEPLGRGVSNLLFQDRPTDNAEFARYEGSSDASAVFIHKGVLEHLEAHSLHAIPNETIGMLLGRVCRDEQGVYVLVMAACTARPGECEGTPGGVRISVAGKAALRARAARLSPGFGVVGWWHSHTHGGPIFSGEDFVEQATGDRHHVGIVAAAARYHREDGRKSTDPIGVYVGIKGERLERVGGHRPSRAIADSRQKPSDQVRRPTPRVPKELLASTAIVLLAILLSSWWTQKHLNRVEAYVSQVTERNRPATAAQNRLVLLPIRNCKAGEEVAVRVLIPRLSRPGIVMTGDPSVAVARLSPNASRLEIACVARGRTTITVRDQSASGSQAVVGVKVAGAVGASKPQ